MSVHVLGGVQMVLVYRWPVCGVRGWAYVRAGVDVLVMGAGVLQGVLWGCGVGRRRLHNVL